MGSVERNVGFLYYSHSLFYLTQIGRLCKSYILFLTVSDDGVLSKLQLASKQWPRAQEQEAMWVDSNLNSACGPAHIG